MDKQILDEHSQIFLEEYKQTFTGLFFHPEDGRDSQLNESLDKIQYDLSHLDNILINTGQSVDDLLSNSVLRLNRIKECIIQEKERYQDIQMLCNRYSDFDNVKSLDSLNFTGNFSEETGNTYLAGVQKSSKVDIAILDIYGNGYEGNEYVYNNYEYQKNVYDTSIRTNMIDNKISTYYEYSRITVQDVQELTNSYFNKDNEKARCTISIQTKDAVNFLDINTEDLGINIINIQYSTDGIKYYDMTLPNKISINNKLDSYENYGYIYGTGIISVPMAQFFKITFEADRDKTDTIAYDHTMFIDTEVRDSTTGELVPGIPKSFTTTTTVKSAKRSAIKINDIAAYKNIYLSKTIIQSEELMTLDAYSIAVFSNVYVPQGLDLDSIHFYLTINGNDYEVIPINSNWNGTKVIRFSGGKSKTAYTQLISEKINSARLTIVLENYVDVTPFINDIKILIGGEI